MILADAADATTSQTYIGQATIAARCAMSERAVVNVMRRLEAAGLIFRSRRVDAKGYRTSDLITLNLTAPNADRADVQAAQGAVRDGHLNAPRADRKAVLTAPDDISYLHPVQGIPQNIIPQNNSTSTSLKSEKPKTARASSVDAKFEPLWTAYPSHGVTFPKMSRGRSKKPKALAEWQKMSREDKEQFEGAVAEYARSAEARKDGGQWVPAFERWIRDETWRAFVPALETAAAVTAPNAVAGPAVNWSERLGMWASGRWNSADWGPKPNEPGCQVPTAVLARHGLGPKPFTVIPGGAA
jgi:biotin operon repressor